MSADRMIMGAPEGLDGLAVAQLSGAGFWITADAQRAERAKTALGFFSPEREIIMLPAFDCLPYDNFSPSGFIAAERAAALTSIAHAHDPIIIASLAACIQKTPPMEFMKQQRLALKTGDDMSFQKIQAFLRQSGYQHVDIVSSAGEYAVRGGMIDVYSARQPQPVRIDFFGDVIEEIRYFDPDTQRSLSPIAAIFLFPASEVFLTEATIRHFQTAYTSQFGFAPDDDRLYASIIAGQRTQGIEHALPFFYPRLDHLFHFLPDAQIIMGENILSLMDDRWTNIKTCYEGRLYSNQNTIPPAQFYMDQEALEQALAPHKKITLSPFVSDQPNAENFNGRFAKDFSIARKQSDLNLMDEVKTYINASTKSVWLAVQNATQQERLKTLFEKTEIATAANFHAARQLPTDQLAFVPLDITRGVETTDFILLCEEDIIGTRSRARRRRSRSRDALMNIEAIQPDDLVVHSDHGIGRFIGLRRIEVAGAIHDCLTILYAENGRLFIPVENADLITRYGNAGKAVSLDRLGGQGWHTRKERIKARLWEMAGTLIALAAERQTIAQSPARTPPGLYEEFCTGFGFEETDDQRQAIEDVIDDLGSGRVMDRLICGDVGFGKTEVALRAAFISAMAGKQVAVIVPTTLLCRQHFAHFKRRFEDFPIRVAQMSRLVAKKQNQQTMVELAEGTIDIVIGTHALLGQAIAFKDLGLAIIDEEQHFGVKDKERLKALRANVHILTLTATPIPRTLQLALSGSKEISLIGDPPVGRLAVHSFIGMFDPVSISQALLREKKRGGQSFFVCPRVRDLDKASEFLDGYVPELSKVVAHGKMKPDQLEEQIGAFYDQVADVLLSTHIVEAGLDIRTANTLVVWHAQMFGLAQLHQLRGRIGRSSVRAYAYFTLPHLHFTKAAEERLHVLSTMRELGAGFSLAARDLDIRGAGNLLGVDQSGHIREIGYELYQKMLAEAVALRKKTEPSAEADFTPSFSPRVKIAAAVLIPENYIPDMRLRLSFYRRIADLSDATVLQSLAEEITDRFGKIPEQVQSLLEVVRLKIACRQSGVEVLDIGANGLHIRFWRNQFANPRGLVQFIEEEAGAVKLSSDHRLSVRRAWQTLAAQFSGANAILQRLAEMNGGNHGTP